MADMWDRGTLSRSSWHGKEKLGTFADVPALLAAGYALGVLPTALRECSVMTTEGLAVPGRAIVASYAQHPERALSVVQDRYRWTEPHELESLALAAGDAGARPDGVYSLRDGAVIVVSFDVTPRQGSSLLSHFLLADSFNGVLQLTTGATSIRPVCWNTVSAGIRQDGAGMAKIRHTASAEEKIKVLRGAIGQAIKSGEKVRETFDRAESFKLDSLAAQKALEALFPAAPDDASKHLRTRRDNARKDAIEVMQHRVNWTGPNLQSLWNAATFLIDREPNGDARPPKGGDSLDSLLLGSRAARVTEIARICEQVMADGSVQQIQVPEQVTGTVPTLAELAEDAGAPRALPPGPSAPYSLEDLLDD